MVTFGMKHPATMQSAMHLFRSRGNLLRRSILSHVRLAVPESPAAVLRPAALLPVRFLDSSAASPSSGSGLEERGFESTTISDILKAKGKSADGSWLWCTTEDTVYDAVKSMTQNNVGALVVVKPGEGKSVAGIITERGCDWNLLFEFRRSRQSCVVVASSDVNDYLRKIIVQGRSSKSTKVGDIMTEENKLITVTPDTKVLQAMQLMTDNRIRHIPVIDSKGMAGMVSIGDVVRAVVSEHREELNRLNAYIQGGY